jgi:hypothetical protein
LYRRSYHDREKAHWQACLGKQKEKIMKTFIPKSSKELELRHMIDSYQEEISGMVKSSSGFISEFNRKTSPLFMKCLDIFKGRARREFIKEFLSSLVKVNLLKMTYGFHQQ